MFLNNDCTGEVMLIVGGVETVIKRKIKFSSYIRKFRGIRSKVIYDYNDLLMYGENCAYPHILGSPSSYMTLHQIPSEFPYI
jgi:hypothetical protein